MRIGNKKIDLDQEIEIATEQKRAEILKDKLRDARNKKISISIEEAELILKSIFTRNLIVEGTRR